MMSPTLKSYTWAFVKDLWENETFPKNKLSRMKVILSIFGFIVRIKGKIMELLAHYEHCCVQGNVIFTIPININCN